MTMTVGLSVPILQGYIMEIKTTFPPSPPQTSYIFCIKFVIVSNFLTCFPQNPLGKRIVKSGLSKEKNGCEPYDLSMESLKNMTKIKGLLRNIKGLLYVCNIFKWTGSCLTYWRQHFLILVSKYLSLNFMISPVAKEIMKFLGYVLTLISVTHSQSF